jgi:short-subunit dehydrogenase
LIKGVNCHEKDLTACEALEKGEDSLVSTKRRPVVVANVGIGENQPASAQSNSRQHEQSSDVTAATFFQ